MIIVTSSKIEFFRGRGGRGGKGRSENGEEDDEEEEGDESGTNDSRGRGRGRGRGQYRRYRPRYVRRGGTRKMGDEDGAPPTSGDEGGDEVESFFKLTHQNSCNFLL